MKCQRPIYYDIQSAFQGDQSGCQRDRGPLIFALSNIKARQLPNLTSNMSSVILGPFHYSESIFIFGMRYSRHITVSRKTH